MEETLLTKKQLYTLIIYTCVFCAGAYIGEVRDKSNWRHWWAAFRGLPQVETKAEEIEDDLPNIEIDLSEEPEDGSVGTSDRTPFHGRSGNSVIINRGFGRRNQVFVNPRQAFVWPVSDPVVEPVTLTWLLDHINTLNPNDYTERGYHKMISTYIKENPRVVAYFLVDDVAINNNAISGWFIASGTRQTKIEPDETIAPLVMKGQGSSALVYPNLLNLCRDHLYFSDENAKKLELDFDTIGKRDVLKFVGNVKVVEYNSNKDSNTDKELYLARPLIRTSSGELMEGNEEYHFNKRIAIVFEEGWTVLNYLHRDVDH